MKRQHTTRLQLAFAVLLCLGCLLLLAAERSLRSIQQQQHTFVDANHHYEEEAVTALPLPRRARDDDASNHNKNNKLSNDDNDDKDDDDICRGYDGVLRIRSGDEGAALGTVFFIYMVNHLLYAERHNLLPWIHLDYTSHRIYDEKVHGGGGKEISFQTRKGYIPSGEYDVPLDPEPLGNLAKKRNRLREEFVEGNGIWETYMEPVSAFSPADGRICKDKNKPLYEMNIEQVASGLHSYIDWGVMAWPLREISQEERDYYHGSLKRWYRPMRRRAATIVRRYFHPKPWLVQGANDANPLVKGQETCLAMHVRTTDKELSGGRAEIDLEECLPFVMKYLGIEKKKKKQNVSSDAVKKDDIQKYVYLATDSESILKTMKDTWPTEVMKRVRTQETALRSKDETPTFDLASHHRTNREVLIDIFAMAKCEQMIHGRSAVSEAVFYLNPDLRETSIDLDVAELN